MSQSVQADGPGRAARAGGEVDRVTEAKRQAARRRFLLGGAGALPVIVTLGQKQALAASMHVCQSAGLAYGDGFTRKDSKLAEKGELAASVYCRR